MPHFWIANLWGGDKIWFARRRGREREADMGRNHLTSPLPLVKWTFPKIDSNWSLLQRGRMFPTYISASCCLDKWLSWMCWVQILYQHALWALYEVPKGLCKKNSTKNPRGRTLPIQNVHCSFEPLNTQGCFLLARHWQGSLRWIIESWLLHKTVAARRAIAWHRSLHSILFTACSS